MNKFVLIAILLVLFLSFPATAQLPPKDAIKSFENPRLRELPPKLPPIHSQGKENCEPYKNRIAQLEALVAKQREVINALQSELQKCKETKDAKKS
jgi:hypothetical protein